MNTVLNKLSLRHFHDLAKCLRLSAAAMFLMLMLLPALVRAVEVGVYVGNDPAEVPPFEQWLGRPVDGVLAYTGDQSWGDMDPGWQIGGYLGRTGRKLYWSIPLSPNAGSVSGNLQTWQEIANGTHDAKYRAYAQTILNSRSGDTGPIYVRTAWELGGEWFWWTEPAKQNPEAFRNAFRRFAMNFHGISNRFKIVWDFVGDRGAVEHWYPGDDAVDVISQDVYWNPQWTSTDPVRAFEMMRGVNSQYSRGLDWVVNFARTHNKGIAISEWGVTGNNAAGFIDEMKEFLDANNVLYATYWNSDAGGYTGKLSTDRWPATSAAFKRNFGTTTPPPATGYYQLVARHSGKCLDVNGASTSNGATVLQWTCHSGQNQQFRLEDVGSGYVRVVARHSGKVLDVTNASQSNGARVVQWEYQSVPEQQWRLEDVGNGYYRLIARHSGKVLDVSGVSTANGAVLHQWDYVGGANQQWLLRAVQ